MLGHHWGFGKMECKKKITNQKNITFVASMILYIAMQITIVSVMKISLYLGEMTAVAILLTTIIWTYFKFDERYA